MFRFLLAGLATWRLAFMLVREDGPGEIFARLRNRLGAGLFWKTVGLRQVHRSVGCVSAGILRGGTLG